MKHIFSKLNLCWILFTTALLTIITLLMQGGVINFYYQSTLYTIGINMILAISLNLIIGVTGQFSLGHAGFMCIGAYAAAIITKATPNLGGFALAVVIGGVISALVALVVAIPTLRLKGDYLAIATLGFSEIVRIIVLNMTITNGAAVRYSEADDLAAAAVLPDRIPVNCTELFTQCTRACLYFHP